MQILNFTKIVATSALHAKLISTEVSSSYISQFTSGPEDSE